tara:strand:+ start:228 stop:410 length:183 start_codon:yes stop_codon:yes gene_type:complete
VVVEAEVIITPHLLQVDQEVHVEQVALEVYIRVLEQRELQTEEEVVVLVLVEQVALVVLV